MPLFRLQQTIRSFGYAGRGLWYVIKRERTFQIHIVAAIIVIILMSVFPLSRWERIVVTLLITLVFVLEIVNTAVEKIIDVLKPRIHFYVQIVKDLMAAAVLVVSIAALIIGIIIFWPHLASLFA